MSLFDKRNSDVDARAKSDLDRLARGGLPAGAERRLNALRQNGTFFTSNLSVNELVMTMTEGVRPLGQVMGSTVYHVAPAAGSAASGGAWSDRCPPGASSVCLG